MGDLTRTGPGRMRVGRALAVLGDAGILNVLNGQSVTLRRPSIMDKSRMDKSRTTTPGEGGRIVALRQGAPAGQERLRLEADGQTHRRDCECGRCEAGFT